MPVRKSVYELQRGSVEKIGLVRGAANGVAGGPNDEYAI